VTETCLLHGLSVGPYGGVVELRFLYVGCDDTDAAVAAWLGAPGTVLRWRFVAFGADVAAIDLGAPPLVLLADHRPAGDVLPIYGVADRAATVDDLVAAGWAVIEGPVGTPEGEASIVRDPAGTVIAVLQVDRPGAMDGAFTDEANTHAVR
jgi:hypothetical protein